MSGSSDNRWRGGPSRQASQRNSNSRDKSGGQGSARDNNGAWGASNPPQEQHVPVRGFNNAEVKNVLKETKLSMPYKSQSKDGPAQRSTAWGSKGTVFLRSPHALEHIITIFTAQNMANGKDFFLELRKQVASLQRSGPPVGG
ncbi:hypothetical protein PDIG_35210 [Penicillium digitatum PHI26]|uniref:Uncharacterized protein n=2 Tax=Penicillium digitatum TaxID=36651 RepID=K9GH05_PEND2|nr:hypothetical protein PDIP_54760 [Penicillium digitatum Pd1]EKV11842.1 hypothetical protein PDIP_54760 [Penicillium digitatum Pd1]EKV14038.1 hypothetical protein PDIG_35210 [Penicillium digitatum PHI26]